MLVNGRLIIIVHSNLGKNTPEAINGSPHMVYDKRVSLLYRPSRHRSPEIPTSSSLVTPLFHTDHESHELIHFKIREDSWNFANFWSKS